jgi:hypothetical protein
MGQEGKGEEDSAPSEHHCDKRPGNKAKLPGKDHEALHSSRKIQRNRKEGAKTRPYEASQETRG